MPSIGFEGIKDSAPNIHIIHMCTVFVYIYNVMY